MRATDKTVRQSVSLPSNIAVQVRSLAKARKLSANKVLVELIESGMEAEKRKQQQFFELAERFRNPTVWQRRNGVWTIPDFLIPDWRWS